MKRYVREFANDQLKSYEQYIETNDEAREKYKQIDRIVMYCEKGLITNFEAVRGICNICEAD